MKEDTLKDTARSRYVLYNLNLFDGETDRLLRDACIVIEGETITGIDRSPDAARAAGFMPVDLQGMTVMPGLIDTHVHLSVPFMTRVTARAFKDISAQIQRNAMGCIEAGITTVRDAGGFPRRLDDLIGAIRTGDLKGPRIIRCNSAITTHSGCPDWVPSFNRIIRSFLGGQYAERVDTPGAADAAVRDMVRRGADWIKLYCQHRSWLVGGGALRVFDPLTFRSIMDAAHRYGKRVCCHISSLDDLKYAMSMGVHTYEHSPLEPIPDETAIEFAARDMVLNPTLTCLDLGSTELWDMLEDILETRGDAYLEPEPLRQVREFFALYRGRPPAAHSRRNRKTPVFDISLIAKGHADAAANVVKVLHAGGRVGVATDSGGLPMAFFGVYYHEELKRLSRVGLNNYQVLRAATLGNAQILEVQDQVGAIRKDRQADLIAVQGNPLNDLAVLENVHMVMKGGMFLKGAPARHLIHSYPGAFA